MNDTIYSLEEAANKFPLLKGNAESYRVRRLRAMINEHDSPCIRDGKKIFLREEHLEELLRKLEKPCLNSSKSKTRPTGTYAAPSRASTSSSLLELRKEILLTGKDVKEKTS